MRESKQPVTRRESEYMNFERIASEIIGIIRSGCSWRGWKWRRASDSIQDRDCAIFHIDFDVRPGTVNSISMLIGFLRLFSTPDKRPDVQHSFFDYLKEQSDEDKEAEVRIVFRLEPRPAEPEAEIMPDAGPGQV
jgi:hypothetical protein